jgi:hypothetical protein
VEGSFQQAKDDFASRAAVLLKPVGVRWEFSVEPNHLYGVTPVVKGREDTHEDKFVQIALPIIYAGIYHHADTYVPQSLGINAWIGGTFVYEYLSVETSTDKPSLHALSVDKA